MRVVGRGAHRIATGKVSVRPRRILPDAVPESADPIRQAAAQAAVTAHGQLAGHRAALLRPAGGQDAHRDAHPGHAAQRQQLQLAVHKLHVTLRLEADDGHARPVVMPRRRLVYNIDIPYTPLVVVARRVVKNIQYWVRCNIRPHDNIIIINS